VLKNYIKLPVCNAALFAAVLLLGACVSTKPAVEKFTVDLNSPKISLGTIDVQFDAFLAISGLRKREITVDYYPREDAVCLQYRLDFMTYHQFWNRENRDAFIKGLEQYKEDYAQRRLGKSSKKTRQQYGSVLGYLIWQQMRIMVRAKGHPQIEIGYFFKDKAPYFTLYQREAEYIDPVSRDSNRNSQEIMMYFTRAQADDLAEIFDPRFLNQYTFSYGESGGNSNINADVDEY